jgi:hypothetical protein
MFSDYYIFYAGRVTGNWRVLNRNKLVPLPVRRDAGWSVTGLTDDILVAMGQWTAAHGVLVIAKGEDIAWPARSPNLSVCDYVLWGYLKSKVNLTKPRDIDEFNNAVKEKSAATPDSMVREAMRTSRDRLEQCRRMVGGDWEMCSSKSEICKSSDVV